MKLLPPPIYWKNPVKFGEIALVLLIIAGLSSCTKEVREEIPSGFLKIDLSKSEIPFYTDLEEMEAVLERALETRSLDDLVKLEESEKRASLGRLSRQFFSKINPDEFKSADEVLSFLEDNSSMIDTIFDEDNEINVGPRCSYNYYSYVANVDGLFVVGDTIYKVFKRGLLWTGMEHAKELSETNDQDFGEYHLSGLNYPFRGIYFLIYKMLYELRRGNGEHGTCSMDRDGNPIRAFYRTVTNGDDRLKLEFHMSEDWRITAPDYSPFLYYRLWARTTPQHYYGWDWFGAWWNKDYRVYYDSDFLIHEYYPSDGWIVSYPSYVFQTERVGDNELFMKKIFVPNFNQDYAHIYWGWFWAGTQQTGFTRIVFGPHLD